ncbi:serine/threonine-protein phosphatase 7 long form-like protein [Cucumis melo var. makuwa]|uniref:Serine/threonine-protein phosphatase 7 long form-like protein n=1 Tax=Cucumis melo var. makuwa TaxID=1194695 RepID=A0A5D3CY94_CUCMM|nr:serine/threonine-protein phosphatase 7 long form-like protein [Cucumis melo var. makuwa]TYK15139.1 serine/threonine-protein phosphatase 7 long form-like protein [Cucumis melo var. makuwa]
MDGESIVRSLTYNWKQVCEDFLEVLLPDMKGQWLSLPWLPEQFTELPPDANVVSVQRYTRAYIMQLIGGFLFADNSHILVHCMFLLLLSDFDLVGMYSCGTASLTWLYKKLCEACNAQYLEIADPLMLLQINWTPYTSNIVALLPDQCHSGQVVWTYVDHMVCFHIIEKHQGDRVLRQFGMLQMPPTFSFTDPILHQIDLEGKYD